jgi:hypothetical protein
MENTGWLSDPIGRITNLSLAPSPKNTLQSLFEAIMNSIHAIEERFGKDKLDSGRIDIRMVQNGEGRYIGFQISDNGIGLNDENMISFRKSDSMKKVKFGGKGVGRLLWLKVSDKVSIDSTYFAETQTRNIKFDFIAHPSTPISNLTEQQKDGEIGTTVIISPIKTEYAYHIPAKLDTVAVRITAHFINYFVNVSCPIITLIDNKNSINLFDKFTKDSVRDKKYSWIRKVNGVDSEFSFNCFLVPKNYSDDESGTNALFFGAHGRAVSRFEMDSVIGLKAIDGKFAFFGYLEGSALNDWVNDTRTEFSLDAETVDDLKRACIENALDFLSEEISEVRKNQISTIALVRKEHLRFYHLAKSPEDIAEKLSLSTQKEEDIFVELSRLSLRDYKRVKKGFSDSLKGSLGNIESKAAEYVSQLRNESTSSLAEYIYKRKLILDVFEKSTGFSSIDEEQAHYEKIVHELI